MGFRMIQYGNFFLQKIIRMPPIGVIVLLTVILRFFLMVFYIKTINCHGSSDIFYHFLHKKKILSISIVQKHTDYQCDYHQSHRLIHQSSKINQSLT